MEKDNIIRNYVCISDDTDTGLMQVLGIVDSLDEAKNICMKHMFADVENLGDDDAQVTHSMWKMMEQETGMILHYSIISDQIAQPNDQKLIILIYDRDMSTIMEQFKKITGISIPPTPVVEDDVDYKGLNAPVKSDNEYIEYNFRFLSTKIHNGTESVIINAAEFRRGSPYIIMQADRRVVYGIAAYGNDDQMVFITTIDDPKDKNFGKPREITITAKDLCSIVKIKYIGLIKGES